MNTKISLVRHGDVHNPDQIYYGRLPDFSLSERGLSEANCAAGWLCRQPLHAIYSSPMLRAHQTAEIIGQRCGLPVLLSDDLNEVLSPFDGIPRSELATRGFDLYTGAASQYEQPFDLQQRLLRFLLFARHHHQGEHIVAVTHGDLVTVALLWANGFAADPRNRQQLQQLLDGEPYPATASITTLSFTTSHMEERPRASYTRPY